MNRVYMCNERKLAEEIEDENKNGDIRFESIKFFVEKIFSGWLYNGTMVNIDCLLALLCVLHWNEVKWTMVIGYW